ncbi:fungal-specific transcription factor domain-containing protein [Exophiala viscosa]|uniref:Fungal-specific transcription factor domain-containing protein n=1 Tax=Exophiala viscosa TaxID=2486360 RepID=A0AAN6E0K1_9EURO|nr:fungal-specific transcription factor domain-containing protein [Exophiala viscosa]
MSEDSKDADTERSRGIKRVRQACSNCRRKKVRCSGERPSCSFCTRLDQECHYLRENVWDDWDPVGQVVGSSSVTDENLIARVTSLEAKLTELSHLNAFIPALTNALGQRSSIEQPSLAGLNDLWNERSPHAHSNETTSPKRTLQSSFQELPPASVLEGACNTFFHYCHNQPYTFFHEGNSRQRLLNGAWPSYLLFAFLASAMRYSTDPWFDGKHAAALEEYASNSWKLIVTSGCAVEEGADTAVVQAISLLAIIDSAAGRRRAAWVKIGLAVRISQDLHLMMEPDVNLPPIEQEERRRLFWSIYLLDRFVSCSKQRPPAILDADCQVQLPGDEADFRQGIYKKTDTLTILGTGASSAHSSCKPSQFALLVLMVCVLGRCARYMLDNREGTEERAPFNPSSEYVTISSVLLYYESFIDSGNPVDQAVRQGTHKQDLQIDQQMVGHVIFTRVLFHLCHCILNHPFLLRQRVISTPAKTPTTWLARSLETGVEHAGLLTKVFLDAKNSGCMVAGSFYGYCLLISGTIHALYTHSQDSELQQESLENLVCDLGYLDDIAKYWKNTTLIASGLRTFWSHSAKFSVLLSSKPLLSSFGDSELDILWTSVDYGVMSDPDKSLSQSVAASTSSPLAWGMSPWKEGNDVGDPITGTDNCHFLPESTVSENAPSHSSTQTLGHAMSISSTQPFLQLNTIFQSPHAYMDFGISEQSSLSPNGVQTFPHTSTRTQSLK